MVTKKTIFNSLLVIAILLTCNAQRAMKLKNLELIRILETSDTKTKNETIKKIQVTTLQDDTFTRLRGTLSPFTNKVLLVQTEHDTVIAKQNREVTFEDVKMGRADGGKLKLFDLRSNKKVDEINTIIFNLPCFGSFNANIPYRFTTKLTEINGWPFLYIYPENSDIIYQFALHTNVLHKKEKSQEKNVYQFGLSPHDDSDNKKIVHKKYTAIINQDRNLRIHHTGSEKNVEIVLQKECTNYIVASRKRDSRFILIYTKNEITLYDNQTGKPAIINGEEINFIDYIPDFHEKEVCDIIFGKNDTFVLVRFKNDILLFDLKAARLARTYSFKERIADISVSGSEKKIIVAAGHTVYFLENPFAFMGFKKLKLVNIIETTDNPTYEEKIRKIQVSTLSNEALKKLGGSPNDRTSFNSMLLVQTTHDYYIGNNPVTFDDVKKQKSYGGKVKLFNLGNNEKVGEIDSAIFNLPCFTSLGENTSYRFTPRLIERNGHPFIDIHLHNSDIICQFDPINKKTLYKKEQNKGGQYNLYLWPRDDNNQVITHHNYTATINQDRNLSIKHIPGNKTIIELEKEKVNNISASPYKDSSYILIYNTKARYRGSDTLRNNIILYDIKTGKPAIIDGEEINFRTIIPNLHTKNLINVIFGKNDAFILLWFGSEIFLLDLRCKRIQTYAFKRGISDIILSESEEHILVTIDHIVYIFENPFVQPDMDLSERVQYLRNPEYIKENQEKIFNISFGGLQTTIPVLKTLLLLNY